MNLNTLKTFRHGVYQSFKQARDALFNLADALVSEGQAQSLPELSLSPFFERKWSSIYEALEDGIIDVQALQNVFITHLPQRRPTPLIAVDSTSIARLKARTSEDRSAQYVHNLPESAKPVMGGSFRRWLPCPPSIASARSMAIVSTNNLSSGMRFGSGLLLSLSAGVG